MSDFIFFEKIINFVSEYGYPTQPHAIAVFPGQAAADDHCDANVAAPPINPDSNNPNKQHRIMYQYQVSFSDAISRAFNNYCNFKGRASRSEYWWFALFNFIIMFILGVFEGFFAAGEGEGSAMNIIMYSAQGLWSLATLLPSLGLFWRRMHDIGKSGAYFFLGLIPLVGPIILLVFLCKDSQMSDNQYGPVPNMTERNW